MAPRERRPQYSPGRRRRRRVESRGAGSGFPVTSPPVTEIRLIDAIRGGLPALAVFLGALFLIQTLFRRPAFRRLNLALTLAALAASLTLFRWIVPGTQWLRPYLQVLATFAVAYVAFKIVEVLTLDVVAVRRGRVPPPGILRDIISAVFALVVLFVLLQGRLGVDITALVATSAALSLVLGLALQETLSNLFAGLALMIERPFEPGDWVRFGDSVGRVKEVSWRAVKIQTLRQESYLIIPNSVAARTQIVNMSQPTPLHGHSVEVGVVYGEPPSRVRRVLVDAALEVEQVMREPRPFAVVLRFDNFAVAYRVSYWIQDFANADLIEGEVRSRIWYAFRRQGIKIPFPTTEVYSRDLSAAEAAARRQEIERVISLLRRVDFLEALNAAAVERLAEGVRVAPYPAGVVVVRQGEAGDSLYVIASGRVEVIAEPPGSGPAQRLAVIDAGDYFGEMSLLTGAPRSATVRTLEDTELLLLTRDALRPILESDPAAVARLSETLARRRVDGVAVAQPHAIEPGPRAGDLSGALLGRIRRFFDLVEY